MNKHVLLYGLLGGLLIALLKMVEYRFLVVEYSDKIYAGLIAAIFAGLGVWLGLRITRPAPPSQTVVTIAAAPAATPLIRDAARVAVAANEDVVPVSELKARDQSIRELERALGRKPMEVEILQAARDEIKKSLIGTAL